MNLFILYFVMQPVHTNNPELQNSVILKVDGFHVREKWALMNPASDTFNFAWLDSQFQRAVTLNRKITLGIYEGTNSPSWLGVRKIKGSPGNNVPLPWDVRVRDANAVMVAALGARYNGHPMLFATHISSPATVDSMEFHFNSSDPRIVQVWKDSIDAYTTAFSGQLVLDIAMIPNARGAFTQEIVNYARQKIGSRLTVIHCSLKDDTNVNAPHHKFVVDYHKAGGTIGFEMVGPSGNSRFGNFQKAIAIGNAAGASWYQIYQGDISKIQR